jgi:hypothetical protein
MEFQNQRRIRLEERKEGIMEERKKRELKGDLLSKDLCYNA